MSIRMKLAVLLVTFLSAMAFTTTASAQAGAACSGTVCGLGGQIRGQIGDGLPLPISLAPGYTGPFKGGTTPGMNNNVVIKTTPIFAGGYPFVGNGLGQQGNIKPTANATIMQTTAVPGNQGRRLTLAPEQFGFGPPVPTGSIGVAGFNTAVFAVRTNLVFDSPHPGTDGGGNVVAVPGGGGSRMFSKGLKGGGTVNQGRPGLSVVSYYAGATGSPGNNYNNTNTGNIIPADGDSGGVNGVARFRATKNQFGGISTGRTLGTAMVYFNGVQGGINVATGLPCTGTAMCAFQLSTVFPATTGVAGGPFGGSANNAAFVTATGVYTGTMGFNGTIVGTVGPQTESGSPIAFTGQPALSVGFPITTGQLEITVTDVVVGDDTEMWIREGTDARDANGNGIVATVTGSMSARTISKGNGNRTWTTLEIPEPSAILAASAGLFALFGCHQLVRRRNR